MVDQHSRNSRHRTVTFRQNLTTLGWIGVVLALGAPLIFGGVLGEYFEGLSRRYYKPDFPVIGVIVLSLASMGGWVMILVGREFTSEPK